MSTLKEYFLLDPTVTFLNHGSFGATPKPVFDEYQRWQRELENQPVEFLGRRFTGLMAQSRAALAGKESCKSSRILPSVHRSFWPQRGRVLSDGTNLQLDE